MKDFNVVMFFKKENSFHFFIKVQCFKHTAK